MNSLSTYRKRRNLSKSKEPEGKRVIKKKSSRPVFVVQKHASSHLHFDLRIEIGGVLKSWAIPKGPSSNPKDKRLAIVTDDHPIEYASFEGVIEKGQYGAGTVMIWDKGKFKNTKKDKSGKLIDLESCFRKGQIEGVFMGKRMQGGYALVRYRGKNWLLIKMKDKLAEENRNLTASFLRSVKTNRSMDEIKRSAKHKK